MSHSPVEGDSNQQSRKAYMQGWRAISELFAQGGSLSGRERNCCFLNLGQGRFADVSAATGVDFPDDGRGVAMVDWDHDGDLDLWITNRTSPAVRMMRNDLAAGNHYLALRLVGKTCNRDSIGARVELFLDPEGNRKRIQSLRAGEGYLAQSSKWLHFGLGKEDQPQKLVIRWPDGMVEEFSGLKRDIRYEVVQGSGIASPWKSSRTERAQLTASKQHVPASSERARIVMVSTARPQLTRISLRQNDGTTISAPPSTGTRLLTLWGSWCPTCVKELNQFADSRKRFKRAGIDVIALSVDKLGDRQTDNETIEGLLRKIDFPYTSGFAPESLVEEVESLIRRIQQTRAPVSIPLSFLLDSENRIVVIYRGPVSVDQIIDDARLVDADYQTIRSAAVPFEGYWLGEKTNGKKSISMWRKLAAIFYQQPIFGAVGCIVLIGLGVFFVFARRRRACRSKDSADSNS